LVERSGIVLGESSLLIRMTKRDVAMLFFVFSGLGLPALVASALGRNSGSLALAASSPSRSLWKRWLDQECRQSRDAADRARPRTKPLSCSARQHFRRVDVLPQASPYRPPGRSISRHQPHAIGQTAIVVFEARRR
jgi:hypothetical protein